MLNVKNHRNGSLGVPTATAVVIAAMVGSGVFTTLGFQVAEIRSTYGGLHVGIAFFLLACAAREGWRRVGLLFCGLTFAGAGIARELHVNTIKYS